MRRFLFGVVIASVTAAMPAWAFGGDREIAQSVMAELQQHKAAGHLKAFDIDLKVEDGVVYLTGEVASEAQRAIVERAAMNEVGRVNLVSELRVKGATPATQSPATPVATKPTAPKAVAAEPTAPKAVPAEPAATKAVAMKPVVTKPILEKPAAPQQVATAVANATPKPEASSQTLIGAARSLLVKTASGVERSNQPSANDTVITDAIIAGLQQSKSSGELRGFDLDVSTTNGDVWLKGSVANPDQKEVVLSVARRVRGVARVIDDIVVNNSSPIRQASTGQLAPIPHAPAAMPQPVAAMPQPVAAMPQPVATMPQPIPQGSSMPVTGYPTAAPMGPQAFAPSGLASHGHQHYVGGGPVPMQGAGGEYGAGAPRYDQPNLPSYAWPSYAAHPNYAAVTYPKQYSPSAWPYIGPFYPYPQVPLGWRKVALEWDDGLWYLDFTSK
jgi:osmotically-inducible protein OsmY